MELCKNPPSGYNIMDGANWMYTDSVDVSFGYREHRNGVHLGYSNHLVSSIYLFLGNVKISPHYIF